MKYEPHYEVNMTTAVVEALLSGDLAKAAQLRRVWLAGYKRMARQFYRWCRDNDLPQPTPDTGYHPGHIFGAVIMWPIFKEMGYAPSHV